MDSQAITPVSPDFAPIIAMVIDGKTSDHTKRAYTRALSDFLAWWDGRGRPRLTKAIVQSYRADLLKRGLAPRTVNQFLTAVRAMIQEAADNGLLEHFDAEAIARVPGVSVEGRRSGVWLTREQAQQLLDAPDISRIGGLRDRAILAVLVGCGLRRFEVAALRMDHIKQLDARWAIVDLVGKRRRIRTIPMPSWCKLGIDDWTAAARITTGRVFRGIYHGGLQVQPGSESITPQVVFDVVTHYANRAGLTVAPHDLRRTFGMLAHRGGAPIEQIQLSLGHSDISVTQKYLNIQQDFTSAPCDVLGLRLAR